jgi:hypothetical protein
MKLTAHALVCVTLLASICVAQNAVERTFALPAARVEQALKSLQPTGGKLPTLDGFANPAAHSLDRYQRAYYQCTIKIVPVTASTSRVKVSAKITAWYNDSVAANSGYQELSSNGRLESDLLDRLQDSLGATASSVPENTPAPQAPRRTALDSGSSISAPVPQLPAVRNSVTGAGMPNSSGAATDQVGALRSQRAAADQHLEELTTEAHNLEEIARNQSHPNNLVAVKKNGAPILASPAEGAKLLFTAKAQDEFEILDMNESWVHVRISGLSRGWIRRSNLEMPDATSTPETNSDSPFHVTNEQTATFPGDWEPLRGKTVAIVTVQGTTENGILGWRAKRDTAKTLLEKQYVKLASSATDAQGVVIIFDSEDGGMLAVTMDSMKQWKSGALTEDAFWKQCFFDPPETFGATAGQ